MTLFAGELLVRLAVCREDWHDPARLVPILEDRLRQLRREGLAGHWSYSLPVHWGAYRLLQDERAKLAARSKT